MLRQVTALRYVTPLREGGSLPGVVEADDLGTYVVKFRGAGQGPKALVAEVVSGELGRRLGLPVPDLAVVHLDPVVARAEPDEEVQELIKASAGANLGMDFLPGALGYDPVAHPVDPVLASRVVAFDAYVENVDRSWRNPNMLIWHHAPWLIDHGATLYFHHDWAHAAAVVHRPYSWDDHVLKPYEYAVIQAVPRIERGELINVGVVLYSQRLDFLAARTHLHPSRLRALDPAADVEAIAEALAAWEATCTGTGAAAAMRPGERFRWLVAPRSTILRAGPVHMGLAADPSTELDRLLELLVR